MVTIQQLIKKKRKINNNNNKTPALEKCPQKKGLCLKVSVVFFYTLGRVSYKSLLYAGYRRDVELQHRSWPDDLEDLNKQIEDWIGYVHDLATQCYMFTSYVKLK